MKMIENIFSNDTRNFSRARAKNYRRIFLVRASRQRRRPVETFVPRSAFLTRHAALRSGGIGFIQTLEFMPFPPDGKWIYSRTEKKERKRKRKRGRVAVRGGGGRKEGREGKQKDIGRSPGTNGDRRARRFHTHNKLLERPPEALIYRGVSPGAVFFRGARSPR